AQHEGYTANSQIALMLSSDRKERPSNHVGVLIGLAASGPLKPTSSADGPAPGLFRRQRIRVQLGTRRSEWSGA
ncbi:MAG: hypothetical protein ABMA14_23425, partial [Hyphomonadaceae bacterium]